MTYADKFYQLLSYHILSIVSYVGEGFCFLAVIMIMICFLGREGDITRKTFLPLWIMIIIVAGINMLCIVHDYFMLMGSRNESYAGEHIILSDEFHLELILRATVITAIVFMAIVTFVRNRLGSYIMAGIMYVFLEFYISTLIVSSAMYFLDKPREEVLKFIYLDMESINEFSYLFILSYYMGMFMLFEILYQGMVKKQRTMYIGWRNRVLFIVWEVFMIFIMRVPIMDGVTGNEKVKFLGYELGIIMPVMGIAVPVLMVAIISRRYLFEKTLIQEDYISAELDYINQYKKNQEETRAFRDDIINNLSVLISIHDDKNYEKAQKYLSGLLGDVRAMSPKFNTGDEMLDCIVGMKSVKMDEEGIRFSVDGVIDGGLGMKPVDVCSIFANALDNAIEACEQMSEKSDKWIKLAIKRTDKFFSIILSNTMVEDERNTVILKLFGEGERVTSKKDRSLHGYGTQNMKSAISKYDGIEKVKAEDGVFSLSIIIPRNYSSI